MTSAPTIEIAPADPAPRSYPPMVTPLRRSRLDPASLGAITVADTEAWLLTEALSENDLLLLYQGLVWRMVAAGLPVVRASLHVGTLHPQLYGYAWNWNSDDGLCDEVKIDESALASDSYRKNPLFKVIDGGQRFRSMTNTAEAAQSPLLRDLRDAGITDYAALPLRAHGTYHNAATVATRAEAGFTTEQFAQIETLLSLFALHVERHIEARISNNLVTTYLGSQAGSQVLQGSIKRGAGMPIEAIIWASDLRGFTNLADTLDDQDLTAVLNIYFDKLVDAVMDHGGEVLKFIGDGLLAVFPFDNFASQQKAADAAIQAAEAALSALEALNADTSILPEIPNWSPLKTGIGLHRGTAFFGNIGAPRRLDFTVIGKAVNTASRVEAMCKPTGRPLLVTGAVHDLASASLESLGTFELKGLDEPVELFASPIG